jgi:NADPH:quinone reductase
MPLIVQFDRIGGPENLILREVPPREPGPKEVRYKVEAFGLNYGELLWLADKYYNSPELPARIGVEACGIVDAIGTGVTEFTIGDRVSSIPHSDGRYLVAGEWAITPERYLVRWPEGIPAEKACSLWAQAITAYYCLVELAKLGPGKTVLITAGPSTTGIGAIQMAKLLGASVVATTRSGAKHDFLRKLGADAVIATDNEDLGTRIRDLSGGRGADVIFDLVAGSMMPRYLEGLARSAQIYVVGVLDGFEMSGSVLPLIRAAATLTGFSIFNHNPIDAQLQRAKKFIGDAFREGKLDPVIDRVFPFCKTIEAYQYLATGQQRGKIVVRV